MNFGELAYGEGETVAHEWQKLAARCEALTNARTLYTGKGWGYAVDAERLLGDSCELWVVSAGFGLVSGDESLPSYAATFAVDDNRVSNRLVGFRSSVSAHAAWWKTINEERGRTQTPLLTAFADYDRVIIALSAPYIAALRLDLEFLSRALGPDKLWLVAVGVDAKALVPELGGCVVPLTSRIERLVSSPRATLNLSTLVWWLKEIVPVASWDRGKQRQEICRRLSEVEPEEARVARALSDKEVAQWIEAQCQNAGEVGPRGGKTGLLRLLRDSGLACEQKRFSRICEEVIAQQ